MQDLGTVTGLYGSGVAINASGHVAAYAFSIVVALFLIGLALGAWFVARKDLFARLRSAILIVEGLTAASLLLSLFVLNEIPALLINLGLRLHVSSWTDSSAAWCRRRR